jgi:hypothetical protein
LKVTGKSVVVTGGALGEVLMPQDVAGTVIEAMDAERFLILPHPRVGASFLRKATDYDGWLSRTRDRLAKMGQPPR